MSLCEYTKNPAIVHDKLKILPLGPKWNWNSRELYGEDREKMINSFFTSSNKGNAGKLAAEIIYDKYLDT